MCERRYTADVVSELQRIAKEVTMEIKPTSRGFKRAEFVDLYGEQCSIQESSLATDDAIWLGCNEGKHHHVTGSCMARMHLNRAMAAELIPLLQHFVDTGYLPD
jgi:hypothetical protein